MKLLNKKTVALALVGVLTAGIGTIPTYASTVRNLTATYNNIRVTLNDHYQSMNSEPFIVNGTTYVGLRDVASLFDINAFWDSSSQTVILEGAMSSQTQVLYEQQIFALNQQVEMLQAKIDQYELINSTYTDNVADILDDLEDILPDTYEDYYDIDWYFTLKEKSTYLEVTIEFYGDDFDDEWDDMTTSQIRRFLTSVCTDILDALENTDLDGKKIKGTIYDSDNSETMCTFEYNSGTLTFEETETTTDVDDLADEIWDDIIDGDYNRYIAGSSSTYFRTEEFEIETEVEDEDGEITYEYEYEYNQFRLRATDFYIVEGSSSYSFYIEVDVNGNEDNWNNIDETYAQGRIDDIMDDILDAIADEYDLDDDDVIGYIKCDDTGTTMLRYKDGDFRFYSNL